MLRFIELWGQVCAELTPDIHVDLWIHLCPPPLPQIQKPDTTHPKGALYQPIKCAHAFRGKQGNIAGWWTNIWHDWLEGHFWSTGWNMDCFSKKSFECINVCFVPKHALWSCEPPRHYTGSLLSQHQQVCAEEGPGTDTFLIVLLIIFLINVFYFESLCMGYSIKRKTLSRC